MALTANVAWRLRATGAEVNGGGFDPTLTTNMLTDGAATSGTGTAPVFSSASYTFVAGDAGAAVYIAAGTNWIPGWYPIASVSAGAATLAAAIDPLRANAILPHGDAAITAGCATTASPTGATWSIDYSWLATPPKSASDLTSTASTTATSASGGLHKAMIGNILRIASGSGATTGYYAIVNVASGTSMTLDAASGTMTAGVFKIGGAHLHLLSYSDGGGGAAPILASPLIAGHKVFVRGGGTDTPGSVDFDFSAGYWTFPDGDLTAGAVHVIGFNGRPRIDFQGLLFYQTTMWRLDGLMFMANNVGGFTTYGVCPADCSAFNCVFDQNGNDIRMWGGLRSALQGCLFNNSGSTSAGTSPIVECGHVGTFISETVFDGCRGPAIALHGTCAIVDRCLIVNGKTDAIHQYADDTTKYIDRVTNCTINANLGHGFQVDTGGMGMTQIYNCIVSNHTQSGKKGINCADALLLNRRLARHLCDYNTWYNNTANFAGWEQNTHDDLLDPGYANAGSKDFSVGPNMKATGYNGAFRF